MLAGWVVVGVDFEVVVALVGTVSSFWTEFARLEVKDPGRLGLLGLGSLAIVLSFFVGRFAGPRASAACSAAVAAVGAGVPLLPSLPLF